ncbi:hypothetical protein M5C99_20820 [Acidovorax sp. NCPPB 2350]|nr:hypothetical protein M5C99_20820 [Acidovorax sp. NCPPB 2350]
MKIEIGKHGKIISGVEAGRYLKIVDDKESSGGYLIITAATSDLQKDGSDTWVENEAQLEKYFEESKWNVDWSV